MKKSELRNIIKESINEIYKEIKEPFSMQQWAQLIDGLDQISHLNKKNKPKTIF